MDAPADDQVLGHKAFCCVAYFSNRWVLTASQPLQDNQPTTARRPGSHCTVASQPLQGGQVATARRRVSHCKAARQPPQGGQAATTRRPSSHYKAARQPPQGSESATTRRQGIHCKEATGLIPSVLVHIRCTCRQNVQCLARVAM